MHFHRDDFLGGRGPERTITNLVQDAQADCARWVDVWVEKAWFELALDEDTNTGQCWLKEGID